MTVDMQRPAKNPVIMVIVDTEPTSDPAESIASASSRDAAYRGIIVDLRILSGIVFPLESLN